jgi:hypothetical protein
MASCHDGNIVTFVYIMGRCISQIVVGLLIFGGCCLPVEGDLPDRWQLYHNPRFHFEFVYPEGWVQGIQPENRDGTTFNDPRNPQITIRSWAGLMRPNQKTKPASNFKTQQGIPGRLDIKIDKQSSLTVTFQKNGMVYTWQGNAPREQFDAYYRFFAYVVSRYQIPNKR